MLSECAKQHSIRDSFLDSVAIMQELCLQNRLIYVLSSVGEKNYSQQRTTALGICFELITIDVHGVSMWACKARHFRKVLHRSEVQALSVIDTKGISFQFNRSRHIITSILVVKGGYDLDSCLNDN